MSKPESGFDGVSENFASYSATVRGFVRYAVAQRNLQEFVSGGVLNVVDVGGGAGIDAAWLAHMGHEVTLIDPSLEQLALGHERLDKLPADTRNRVHVVNCTAEDLIAENRAGNYDLVLSHGVAMYVEDRAKFIGDLVMLARNGGHISLLEKSFAGHLKRMQQQGKPQQEIENFQRTQTIVNNVGRECHAFRPDEMENLIAEAGARMVRWSGVRIESDYMEESVADLDPYMLEAVVGREYRLGKNPALRESGQMSHFITQKLKTTL